MVAVEPFEVFDIRFLEKLRAFHADLEREVPHAQEVISLINARHIYGEDDDLIVEDLVDFRFSKASFVLRVPDGDAVVGMPFIDEIEAHFRDVLGKDVQVTMTGSMVLMARTQTAAIFSMAKSYAIAFLLVTMGNLFNLGVFAGFAIVVAFLADVLLAPALMVAIRSGRFVDEVPFPTPVSPYGKANQAPTGRCSVTSRPRIAQRAVAAVLRTRTIK